MEGDYNKPLIKDPEFDSLIPKPRGIIETIKRNAKLEDTIAFLPKAMKQVVWQVKKIIPLIEADTLMETCENIWTRLYSAIRYKKDDEGKEQIRSPRCTWWGRRGDCDDFSVFVSAILCNLKIPHLFRIAMYKKEDGYQHIYIVAIAPDGKEIIIDCVLSRFNKEVPYIQKIDEPMELQFLDGVDDEFLSGGVGNIDTEDLLRGDLGDLGRKKLKDTKFGKALKQGLHLVNRVNPAMTLLRVGILACMKVNLFRVAGALRYTYLSDDQAKQKGIDMTKFPKLKNIREKLEKIFYGAGGKEENLKKAILTGHGNKNKDVPLSGLGSIEGSHNENDDLPQLLGIDTYNSETNEAVSLGDPATGTAIAAASSAMAALAALIKSLGVFKKGGNKSDVADPSDGSNTTDNSGSGANNTNPVDNSGAGTDNAPPINKSTTNKTDTSTPTDGGANNTDTPAAATDGSQGDDSANSGNDKARGTNPSANKDSKTSAKGDGLMKRFATWASANKPAAIGLGVGAAAVLTGIIVGIVKLANHNAAKKEQKQTAKEESKEPVVVSGVPKSKKHFGSQKQRVMIHKLR